MNSGKLQAYASLAEVVSALAVVATLLYVSNEFRRSSTIDNREADLMLFHRIQEAHRQVIEVPGMAEIIITAATAERDLTPADRLRYLTYQDDFFNSWEIAFYYHEDRILGDALWQEWDEWFVTEARRRPRFGWLENRQNYSGLPFRQHVDAILARHEAGGS